LYTSYNGSQALPSIPGFLCIDVYEADRMKGNYALVPIADTSTSTY